MFAALIGLCFAACDLGELFERPDAWQVTAEEFVHAHGADGFRFASGRHDQADCLAPSEVTWYGEKLYEAKVYFEHDLASHLELSLYNRGDAERALDGRLDAAALEELLGRLAAKAEPAGRLGRKVKREELRRGGFRYERCFTGGSNEVVLVWGVDSLKTKEQTANFVRLAVSPKRSGRPRLAAGPVSGIVAGTRVKANVVREANGDVRVDNVPMVDQGQKGYCACAVAERVLRYYGKDVDEHEIAQMAGTTAGGGTSVKAMIETVRAVASRHRLAFKSVVALSPGDLKDVRKEVDAYNKAAKALKEREIDFDSAMHGCVFDVGELRSQMKSEVVLRMRTKDARFRQFLSGVKAEIDRGVPVIWGVTLGMFPEEKLTPQTRGGHMRLIIGYNAKTREILYTDTWGAGHELKRMREDQAFAMTHDAFALKPL